MLDQILSLLEEKKHAALRALVDEMNPVDLAAVFEELNLENTLRLFRLLPKELAVEVFAYMDSETRQQVVEAATDKELQYVIEELYIDDTVDLIEEMPANVVKKVLRAANPEDRKAINQILNYPDDCAGSIMTTEFVDLKKNMVVSEAFEHIRKTGPDKETIYTCYVTNENRLLDGVVTVKELLLANPSDLVGDIMETNVIYANTLDDQEDIAHIFRKYDMITLPVVDKEKRLVGIITIDDAVDVMQEENTEDFQRMAAISPTETTYMKTSAFTHARKRILWLMFLMFSAMLTGMIITHYESSFVAYPLLVACLPMVMGTSGNCGTQSATLIIRGMALDEIRLKDFLRVWFKEVRIAMLVGVVLIIVNGLRIYLQYGDLVLALITGATLFFTITLAKSLGCLLPMLAKKINLDPAIMASPLIATVSDACSTLIYFSVAVFILQLHP